MLNWEARAPEVAHLLNPAFCTLLLRDAARGYNRESRQTMPFALAFLVLALVLHKATRESLPTTTKTKLIVWLQDHQDVKINLAHRMNRLVPFTKEALLFGLQCGLLAIDELGHLLATRKRLRSAAWPENSEPELCRKKAFFVGQWLARVGDSTTVFAVWGISP